MPYNLKEVVLSGNGTTITAVTAVSGASIKIWGLFLTVSGATNITYQDGTTALSGAIQLTGAGSSDAKTVTDSPYFYCQPGDAFTLGLSTSVTVSGTIYYSQGG